MKNYLKGRVNETLALSTLSGGSLISGIFDDLPTERTLIGSVVATWSMQDFTLGLDDGPIMVGLAHSDYTDTEIAEVINSTGSWDSGDLISKERANRKIRTIGVFDNEETSGEAVTLNDGKPIHTKLNWVVNGGQGLRLWAFNLGGSDLATTSPKVRCDGHANIWTL